MNRNGERTISVTHVIEINAQSSQTFDNNLPMKRESGP